MSLDGVNMHYYKNPFDTNFLEVRHLNRENVVSSFSSHFVTETYVFQFRSLFLFLNFLNKLGYYLKIIHVERVTVLLTVRQINTVSSKKSLIKTWRGSVPNQLL